MVMMGRIAKSILIHTDRDALGGPTSTKSTPSPSTLLCFSLGSLAAGVVTDSDDILVGGRRGGDETFLNQRMEDIKCSKLYVHTSFKHD